jgi:CubicO group peptidase (beta-lactamase class C family)
MAAHINAFSTYLTAVVEGGTLPGIDVAVLRKDGSQMFRETHGSFKEDQIYRIYSNTKPVVAVAILILMERGLLTLDTELRAILPQFASQTVLTGGTVDAPETEPVQTHITIKHLLQHTAGMSYGIFGEHVVDQLLRKNIGPDHATFFENTPLSVLVDRIAEVCYCTSSPF